MKGLAVVIGRFQPVHTFHVDTLFARAAEYEHVLVLLGSSYKALDQKNPFTPEEREMMIRQALAEHKLPVEKFAFAYLKDYPYSDNRWVLQVQKLVEHTADKLDLEPILVGVDKDDTTFYLKLFPQWKSDIIAPKRVMNATDIRAALFEGTMTSHLVSPATEAILQHWIATDEGKRIQAEYMHAKKTRTVLAFKDEQGNLREAPYKPIAYCTDNVVTWRGHVLLIRRRSHPGKGLWALPGGHLNINEWVKQGAIRELQEETHIYFYNRDDQKRRLQLSPDWCRASHQFDYPSRSQNGRKITTAFHWVIPDEYEVHVEADDDADKAQWFPFYEVFEEMDYSLFEDHQSIIAHMVLGINL